MKQLFAALLLALTFNSQAMAQPRTVKLRVIQTSDVHGSFFPYVSSIANRRQEPWHAYPLM